MINLIEKVSDKLTVTNAVAPMFNEEYDVAVIGLGVAGAISAITAAKKKLKVLGIERLTAAGGTMTMCGISGYYFGNSGGIFEQVDDSLRKRASLVIENEFIHPDLRKYNLDCEIRDNGIYTMYESIVTALYTDGRKIVGLRVFHRGTEKDIAAKVIIDATGDGDICDMAGCSMDFGRKRDGSVVPFTISESFIRNGAILTTNHDSGKIDQRNIKEFSHAILEAQSFFAKKKEGQTVMRLNSLPGVREGRLLNGEKKIRIEDFLNGKYEKEPVMYAYADLDKHGTDTAFDSEIFRRWHVLSNLGALNISVPVPMGSLIAKEYDNLLVAGRCLSVDHEMQTCIRMNRDMQKVGEISATLAYVALEDNVSMSEVKYERVAPYLRETGCLDEENNRGFRYDGSVGAWEGYVRKASWFTTAEEINENLATLSPGVAIWSCRLLGNEIIPTLIENLNSNNDNLKKHSAIALANMDRSEGISVLREIVVKRDRTELTDMRKNNKSHIVMALCALGILKDEGSIDIIKEVITDRLEHTFYTPVNNYIMGYYITLSSAVSALFDIVDAHPKKKKEIGEFLENEFSSLEYIKKITTLNEYSSQYIMAKDIYENIRIWNKGDYYNTKP